MLEPNLSADQNVDELRNMVLITKINESYIFLPHWHKKCSELRCQQQILRYEFNVEDVYKCVFSKVSQQRNSSLVTDKCF